MVLLTGAFLRRAASSWAREPGKHVMASPCTGSWQCPRILPCSDMPIPLRQRAAALFKACSALSTTSTHLSALARYPRHSGARPGGFLLGPRRGSQPPRLNLQESSRDESVERSSEGVPYARS